jgi:hypothetical protein
MGARDMQIGGDHYQRDIQPWDIIDCYNLTFYEGNVIKYVLRHREKNGIEDLKKAKLTKESPSVTNLNLSVYF